MINPEEDGITHINIYSKGKTHLGRFLSNFTLSPIKIKNDKFNSIEGYWYYLLCGLECNNKWKNELKNAYGFEAKKLGKKSTSRDWDDSDEFKNKIKNAIIIKINTYNMVEDIVYSELPFDHYYVYGGAARKSKEAQWLIDFFNDLRIK